MHAQLATTAASPRKEVIHEAHPHGRKDDGNGQALRVGDFKVVFEKGPMWSTLGSRPADQNGGGPKNTSSQNDWWFPSGSNPERYTHVVTCGLTPAADAADFCDPAHLPCLFNVATDPCEYHDLSKTMPAKLKELVTRLADYQVRNAIID